MPHEHRPPEKDDRYTHAAIARRLALVMQRAKEAPLAWAQEIALQHDNGKMRPRTDMADAKAAEKLRASMKPELAVKAYESVVRGENELRLRSLIRATRTLERSPDKRDQQSARTLAAFIANVWGVRRAYEVVGEGDVDDTAEFREMWGDAQLPPPGAMCGTWVADELLISAAVRRLK